MLNYEIAGITRSGRGSLQLQLCSITLIEVSFQSLGQCCLKGKKADWHDPLPRRGLANLLCALPKGLAVTKVSLGPMVRMD